jgi:hypothetical protein
MFRKSSLLVAFLVVNAFVTSSSADPAVHQPFTPYSTGPAPSEQTPKPTWSYDDLTPAEKVVVDKGRDTTGWDKVHEAYGRASAERARIAQQQAAQLEIGLDDLGHAGVIL